MLLYVYLYLCCTSSSPIRLSLSISLATIITIYRPRANNSIAIRTLICFAFVQENGIMNRETNHNENNYDQKDDYDSEEPVMHFSFIIENEYINNFFSLQILLLLV